MRMEEVRACIDALGYGPVSTYIQSGNIVFCSRSKRPSYVADRIRGALKERFGYEGSVAIRSLTEMRAVVKGAPKAFTDSSDALRCDVLYVLPGLTVKRAMEQLPCHPDVDRIWNGNGVVYYARKDALASKSRLSRVTQMPLYQHLTIRNWRTTNKVLDLMEAADC